MRLHLLNLTAFCAVITLLPGIGLADRASCDLALLQWSEGKYFQMGDYAYQNGQWYRAREPHSRIDPTSGHFAWEQVNPPESCRLTLPPVAPTAPVSRHESPYGAPAIPGSAPDKPSASHGLTDPGTALDAHESATTPPPSDRDMHSVLITRTREPSKCAEAEPWNYANSYHAGERVTKDGNMYEAIFPTNATIPGSIGSPHWVQIECSNPP